MYIKTANNKKVLNITREEWFKIAHKAGWDKELIKEAKNGEGFATAVVMALISAVTLLQSNFNPSEVIARVAADYGATPEMIEQAKQKVGGQFSDKSSENGVITDTREAIDIGNIGDISSNNPEV